MAFAEHTKCPLNFLFTVLNVHISVETVFAHLCRANIKYLVQTCVIWSTSVLFGGRSTPLPLQGAKQQMHSKYKM